LQRVIPDTQVRVLDGQRHMAFLTAPNMITDAVRAFVPS
jgi:hypothetical protein